MSLIIYGSVGEVSTCYSWGAKFPGMCITTDILREGPFHCFTCALPRVWLICACRITQLYETQIISDGEQ